MKIKFLLLLLIVTYGAQAQFVFKPADYTLRKTVISPSGGGTSDVQLNRVNRADTKVFQNIPETALHESSVERIYGVAEADEIIDVDAEISHFTKYFQSKKPSGWRSTIPAADVARLTSANTTFILNNTTVRRHSKGISAQAIAGLYQKIDNNLSETSKNFFELGSRLSDIRLKLYTKVRYEMKKNPADASKYILTRNQRSRFLYVDFISRGLLALDSLSTTVNEYVNTLQGSPLCVRLAHQINLTNPTKALATGEPEPELFVNFLFDARLIPVALGKEITSAGGSFHFIPSFTASFPSGKGDDDTEGDRFVIQVTGNAAYITNDAAKILYLGQTAQKSYALSLEARMGLFSTEHPERNFNFLFKYNLQEVNGSRASIGFSFAPQVKKEEAKNPE